MADETTVPRIELAAAKGPIPTCSPNLMPFHIQYSGPAPVSTYFRVRPSADPSRATGASIDASNNDSSPTADRTETSDSQETLVADHLPLNPIPSTSSVATLTGDVDMSQMLDEAASANGKHFVAAFRGRTVRGTQVDLPQGFAGVVLGTPETTLKKPDILVKTSEGGQRKTRARRAASTKQAVQVEEAEEEQADAGMEGIEGQPGPVRMLEAKGTFTSFMLWHPDIPVDGGRDEYLRSLTEWTNIAAEIHHHDD